jgi:pyrroloquinoline quinone (PQQ) biosynthesis protein C
MLSHTSPDDRLHHRLATFNLQRMALGHPSPKWEEDLANEYENRKLEGRYLEQLRLSVKPLVEDAPRDSDHFVEWFQTLDAVGPGQDHPFFDWLATEADLTQMRWFLTQEAAGEAGFDDLLAYAQVKLPPRPKLECARNFWDEMGHGKQSAMHGQMLDNMVQVLGLEPSIDTTVWQSLALANTMLGLATTRRYAYHALGALGVIELTAPGRVKKVSAGMRRLGLNGRMRAYFDLHAALDVSHAKAWIREVIRPLVEADPGCASSLAEGALMRLQCGARCFDRYALELQCGTRIAPMLVAETEAC